MTEIKLFPNIDFAKEPIQQDFLSDFLVENGFKYGYAEFWTAGRTSLASEWTVKIVPASNGIISLESAWLPYKNWLEEE